MMKSILVAIDGSEGSDRALDFAVAMAKDLGARLSIVNVIGGYGLPGEALRRLTDPQTAWLDELLDTLSAEKLTKAQERARTHGASDVRLESRRGDVTRTILDIADELNADAIVIGKRGSGRLEGILLGSVSQKLASLASRPVVVVP